MTLTAKSPADRLRQAVAMVRGNPAGIAELDAEDRRKAAEVVAAAKKKAEREAKVNAAIDARAASIAADYEARQAEAIQRGSRTLARYQLEREFGLIDPRVAAMTPALLRLTNRIVQAEFDKLANAAPLSFGPGKGRTADEWASTQAREASTDDVGKRIAERQQKLAEQAAQRNRSHEARQAANAERKRKAGIIR